MGITGCCIIEQFLNGVLYSGAMKQDGLHMEAHYQFQTIFGTKSAPVFQTINRRRKPNPKPISTKLNFLAFLAYRNRFRREIRGSGYIRMGLELDGLKRKELSRPVNQGFLAISFNLDPADDPK